MQSIYSINPEDQIIGEGKVEGYVWGDNEPTITTFFTSSVQVNSTKGQFNYEVWDNSDVDNTDVKFNIGFADRRGRGSVKYSQWGGNKTNTYSPTGTNYHQMKALLEVGGGGYDPNLGFLFGDTYSDYFYVINISRAGYKEKISTEGMTLTLTKEDTAWETISLTNDARINNPIDIDSGVGEVYQMVLGENGVINRQYDERGYSANDGSYGWFMPKLGLILLNAKALDSDYADGGMELGTELDFNTENNNPAKLFSVIQQQWGDTVSPPNQQGFSLLSEETLKEKYIFVNIPSDLANYSNNPTFASGSEGNLAYDEFISDPQVYITSVGFYNDKEELVAVAKLGQPLLKDFAKHLMLRTKLDF